jgi:hypothetical protein
MAVVIKSKGLQLLTKLGISQLGIDSLKAKGVTLAVNHKTVSFYSADNGVLASGELPVSATDLLSAGVSYFAKKTGKEILAALAQDALKVLIQGPLPVAETVVPASPVQAVAVEANPAVAVEANPVSVFQGAAKIPFGEVIPLRDATKMYQRVRGTSSGSVYVVVALNDAIRIAARVTGGTNLAIRAEPSFANPFLPADVVRLKGQSIEYKQGYASGHFECGKVSPARMLGAVLVGLGIAFDTPLPDMDLVITASK